MTSLSKIEGIGEAYAQKLQSAGVKSIAALLKHGATPRDRKALAEKSGISEALLLRWINHADLFRIKGVGGQYAELLEAAGVDTVIELAKRNPGNLYTAMTKSNDEHKRVRQLPSARQVTQWVQEARQLPRAIEY